MGRSHVRPIMRRASDIVYVVAILSASVACLPWPNGEVSSKEQDRVLFEHAISAIEQGRLDMADLTLQTLVNTYPDSNYAREATEILQDPQFANCVSSWNSLPECDGQNVVAALHVPLRG